MKKFLLKIGLFTILCIIFISFVLMQYAGNIDYFYNKFTTPKASSMIIGDSRSMQGIQPKIIDEKLGNLGIELPMLNYSFTIAQAPIGPLYTKSILKKLNPNTKNGVFIISMTPWMLGSDKLLDNDIGEFRESNAPPHNMNYVSSNPNYEYFIKNFSYFHFKALFRKSSTMHKDGWLEENNLPSDSLVFKQWKKNQIRLLHNMEENLVISDLRLNSLDSLIKNLKSYGHVFLVRMPIDDEFLTIENSYYPLFDKELTVMANNNDINYINFTLNKNNQFKTYDGHHLDKLGGKGFTKILCDTIIKSNFEPNHNLNAKK